jgi:hypothetical protein
MNIEFFNSQPGSRQLTSLWALSQIARYRAMNRTHPQLTYVPLLYRKCKRYDYICTSGVPRDICSRPSTRELRCHPRSSHCSCFPMGPSLLCATRYCCSREPQNPKRTGRSEYPACASQQRARNRGRVALPDEVKTSSPTMSKDVCQDESPISSLKNIGSTVSSSCTRHEPETNARMGPTLRPSRRSKNPAPDAGEVRL